MTELLNTIDRPAGPARSHRRAAAGGRPGGARAHHRHRRGDRRPLRRQPRHLRDRRRAALAARLPARQDPLGRRPSGLSAQGPHRPPRRSCRRSASTAAWRRSARSPSPSTTSWAPATPRPRSATPSGIKEAMRARPRRGRQRRRGRRRRCDDRRRRLRGRAPGRRRRHADRRRAQRQRDVDRAQRRRALALLQPRAPEPEAVARPRGGRGRPDQAAGGHRVRLRAPRPALQGVDQGLLGAGTVVGGARLRLHGRHRRPRRARAAPRAARGAGRRAARRRPLRHGQGQGLRPGRGGRPRGHGAVARGQAQVDRQRRPRRPRRPSPPAPSPRRRSTPRCSARRWWTSAAATSA